MRMRKSIFGFFLILLPLTLSAQMTEVPAVATVSVSSPGFFTSLITGLILAFGFQLILTNLSAVIGLSALHAGMGRMQASIGSGEVRDEGEESEPFNVTARKVNASFGIWAIITASISLFFAAWLAVKIGTPLNLVTGVVLGLAIWGLFYIITAVLEMTAVASLVGSLMDIVRSGFRSFSDAASGLFGKSGTEKPADTARKIAGVVRDEILSDVNVQKTIQNYIQALKPDYDRMRKEITAVLDDAQIDVKTTPELGVTTAHIHTGTAGPTSTGVKEGAMAAAGTVKSGAETIRREARSDKGTAEKAVDTAMQMTGLSQQEAEQYRRRLEAYLSGTGKNELNPEGIERDIDRLVSDPGAGMEAILARLESIDLDTIKAVISQRKDMNSGEASRMVDMVAGAVAGLKSSYRGAGRSAGGSVQETQSGLEARLQSYFDSLDNRELHYDRLREDFERMLRDPLSGSKSVIARLRTISRSDIGQMITRSGMNVSEQDMDQIADRIEQVEDSILSRVDLMQREAMKKVRHAQVEAIQMADSTRKVAASAALWVFAAALVSGVAAAAGGLVGIMV